MGGIKLDIEDVKYLFTDIGGGWGYTHNLFAITRDDKIYYTSRFNDSDLLDCTFEFVCDLYPSNLQNHCISTLYNFDGTEKSTYLFDLLDSNGKVDFEKFNIREYCVMDGTTVSLYKNINNKLKLLVKQDYSSGDMPAVRYVYVLWSTRRQR